MIMNVKGLWITKMTTPLEMRLEGRYFVLSETVSLVSHYDFLKHMTRCIS